MIAKTVEDFKKTIKENPYPTSNEKYLAVIFLNNIPENSNIEIHNTDNDEFTILNDVVYIYCPNGFGRSKLTINVFEKKLNVIATSRNWKTTNKLLELVIK